MLYIIYTICVYFLGVYYSLDMHMYNTYYVLYSDAMTQEHLIFYSSSHWHTGQNSCMVIKL